MKNIRALIISVNIVVWYVVIVTIASELSASLKALLTAMTGHHWVTKSVLAVILLGLTYLLLKRTAGNGESDANGVYTVIGSVAAGSLIIFIFYLWHFLA